jgi:hypothetical protein
MESRRKFTALGLVPAPPMSVGRRSGVAPALAGAMKRWALVRVFAWAKAQCHLIFPTGVGLTAIWVRKLSGIEESFHAGIMMRDPPMGRDVSVGAALIRFTAEPRAGYERRRRSLAPSKTSAPPTSKKVAGSGSGITVTLALTDDPLGGSVVLGSGVSPEGNI